MDLIQSYSSSDSDTDEAVVRNIEIPVGTDELEDFLGKNSVTRNTNLNRKLLDVKRKFVTQGTNDKQKENFTYTLKKEDLSVKCRRNRLSDRFVLTDEGREKQRLVHEDIAEDVCVANWVLYCPGHSNCLRKCGGLGSCTAGK